jgi:hypothetical protein
VLGYGGDTSEAPSGNGDQKDRRTNGTQGYNPNSLLQIVGNGTLTPEQDEALTDEEKKNAGQ